MTCESCREELSAALDGAADPALDAATAAHLAACPACLRWREHAERVTRRARTAPAEPGPDLVEAVLAATAPTRRAARRRGVAARVALAVVGVVQVALGVLSLLDATGPAGADAAATLGAGMAHMGHETAAWNLAVGAAFLAGAWWTRHVAGLLPVLGAFIVVLGVLSVVDLVAGRVDPVRVVAHLLLVAGFVLSLIVSRRAPGRGPGGVPGVRGWRRRRPTAAADARPVVAGRVLPRAAPEPGPVARRGREAA